MEFGNVIDSLHEIDFSLPLDTELTTRTLKENGSVRELSIYVGASKWGEKTWKSIIYPPKSPDNHLLGLYSNIFNAVEFGPSFYKIYSAEDISKWTAQVAENNPSFKFCPKFPQNITHIRRLANAELQTNQFYESLMGFGSHLGPLLLQLGDNFSPKSFPQLQAFIRSLNPDIKVAVEVRNKNWFEDATHRQGLFDLLAEHNIGTVISDTSGRRDAVHMELTTTDAFIRFVGNNLDHSDYKRMDDWVERIKNWKEQGLKSVWFFMHQNNERFVPEACVYFIKQLNAKLGASIKPPTILNPELF
jgi:uncharacterized protein YecE (DUF72 family)